MWASADIIHHYLISCTIIRISQILPPRNWSATARVHEYSSGLPFPHKRYSNRSCFLKVERSDPCTDWFTNVKFMHNIMVHGNIMVYDIRTQPTFVTLCTPLCDVTYASELVNHKSLEQIKFGKIAIIILFCDKNNSYFCIGGL